MAIPPTAARPLLVNVKSNDPAEGAAIVEYARARGFDLRRLSFSGGDAQAGSEVYVMGPLADGLTTAIDGIEQLRGLPADYDGGVVTDRIELLGQRWK